MKLVSLLIVAALCGCTGREEKRPVAANAETNQPSSAQLAIDGLTGKASVDAYKRARQTIDKANEAKRRSLDNAGAAEQP
jgi:hypothetical protein